MDSDSMMSKVKKSVKAFNKQTAPVLKPLKISENTDIDEVLTMILGCIQPVDFDLRVDTEDGKAPTPIQKAVVVIEELVETSRKLNRLIKIEDKIPFLYDGRYWRTLSPDETQSFLGKVAEKMGYNHCDARNYKQEERLFRQLKAGAYKKAIRSINDKILINVNNCTLEITADEIVKREHLAEDNFRYCLSFDYDPDAKCPQFEKFLDEVLPDKECQRLLLEYLGYVFTKRLKFEKVLFLYGDGKNGKSVVYEITRKFFGEENVSNYSLEEITTDKNYCKVGLQDVLLNYGSDISDKLNSDMFKRMASLEPIFVRDIYLKGLQIYDYAKQMYNTNNLPEKGVDYSYGHFRRLLVIPFSVTIKDEDVDVKLAEKIYSTELSGIFNLVLANLQTIIEQERFSKCTVSDEIVEELSETLNPISQFLAHGEYEKSNDDRYVLLEELYLRYKEFTKNNQLYSISNQKFSTLLRAQGFRIEKIGRKGRRVFIKQKN